MNKNLSKESQKFLDNLQIYLVSSGKNERESNEIVEELTDHLRLAESEGKSVQHIIGHSPKDYMEQLAAEMAFDKKAWIKFIVTIILGVFSYTILTRAASGNLSFSLLNVIGLTFIVALLIGAVFMMFKYIAANSLSKTKEYSLYFLYSLFSLLLFIGLILLDQRITTPVVNFSEISTLIIALLTFAFLVAVSFWSKTWIVLIFLAFLVLPDLVLNQMSIDPKTQISLSTTITFGGIAVYLFVVTKRQKKA
ncbi:DUF1129 family protein [Cytobacillus purgationiresistens]|uniref:DNA-binding ferritin-like protein (Dps family) n=1 Tax=Cytobacillus purgationiresistens TaxID=863449 RepID=A0ABU0AMS1_9BACI|nr:hypothetical protein [Cytobacillus purgationiresistens]MDQ0271683.1 DNA-binding ferritin-like protein (Dps family) [Cytobacillus purgationiresistens]